MTKNGLGNKTSGRQPVQTAQVQMGGTGSGTGRPKAAGSKRARQEIGADQRQQRLSFGRGGMQLVAAPPAAAVTVPAAAAGAAVTAARTGARGFLQQDNPYLQHTHCVGHVSNLVGKNLTAAGAHCCYCCCCCCCRWSLLPPPGTLGTRRSLPWRPFCTRSGCWRRLACGSRWPH